jgi:hypothetical protein
MEFVSFDIIFGISQRFSTQVQDQTTIKFQQIFSKPANSYSPETNKLIEEYRLLTLVITDVSEESIASVIWVTRIGELGTTFSSQRASVASYC